MGLEGWVVLVTGASKGIGQAVAQEFAGQGATVVVQYRSDEGGARETMAALGDGDHLLLPGDVADPASVTAMVERVVAERGRIDVLVNNAGVYVKHPVDTTPVGEWRAGWRSVIDTNLIGPANLIHAVVPHMVAAGGGRIVNITSRGAFRGEPEHAAYGASKAGLNSLGQSMAQALAPFGIYVTTVAPGFVETPMAAPYLVGEGGDAIKDQSPLRRAAAPEEVARMVVFLASPGTEYATGTIVDVNGASYLRS